jgi:protein-tyrosine phosphatase
MAEGILKKYLSDEMLEKIKVISSGIVAYKGAPASPYAISVSKKRNVDISGHRSQPTTEELAKNSDIIFCMADEHSYYVKSISPDSAHKVFLLKAFNNKIEPDENYSVDDPMGYDIEVYERVFDEIEMEIERILPKLIKMAKENKI